MEALAGKATPYQAWALSEVEICPVPVNDVHRAIDRAPELRMIVERAIDEMVRSIGDRRNLGGRSVVRVARFLLQRERMGLGHEPFTVPHHILARMIGMRAETFSRALRQLRQHGAVEGRTELRVSDHGALERAAEES
jgi:CRP-like cAMP-binding protein